MGTLTIKDLSVDKELDRQAMQVVHGGRRRPFRLRPGTRYIVLPGPARKRR